jgi:hypothetical protein
MHPRFVVLIVKKYIQNNQNIGRIGQVMYGSISCVCELKKAHNRKMKES